MKRAIPFLLLATLLMAADTCESAPEGGTAYCNGNEYTIMQSVVDFVQGSINTILYGEPSTNRRATVRVTFGSSYCSGVVIGPHTVLTAAHCGYDANTSHVIKLEAYGGDVFHELDHHVHPDYFKDNHHDLMIIHTIEELPEPYISGIYESRLASLCRGLVAQGWGAHEGTALELREARYLITQETDLSISSRLVPDGKICFGDSGGPLYADVGGVTYLAGITSTTMSTDCKIGGTHVKVAAPSHMQWLMANLEP